RIVERPARPAASADAMPAGPPPSTTTSYSPNIGVSRSGSRTCSPVIVRSALPWRARSLRFVQPAGASRHDRARAIDLGSLAADHQLVRVVRLLADVFEELRAFVPLQLKARRPRRRVGTRVVDRDLVIDERGVDACEALDDVELLRMRQAASIHPEAFVEADAVDDEGAALPPADRVAVIAWLQVARMRTAVHVHGAEGVRPADIEDVEPLLLGQLDELDAVRRQELARGARGFAARMRLELVDLTAFVKSLRPRLERHLVRRRDRIGDTEERCPHAFLCDRRAAEQHAAVLGARRRPRRREIRIARTTLRERRIGERETDDRGADGKTWSPHSRLSKRVPRQDRLS